jgi:acyl-lipid omega-6 desaturase (Delta-12 desaturase)
MNSMTGTGVGTADGGAIRRALLPYIAPSAPRALALFLATVAVYGGAVWLAGFSAMPLPARVIGGVLAGLAIPSLFVIGHDAAHGAFAPGRIGNLVIARLAFLPALHNLSLWRAVHNRQHHRLPNLKGNNSWSPLGLDEYRRLTPAGRALARFYRSIFGFAPYYLVERWWRDKFFPRRTLPGVTAMAAWGDFAFLLICLAGFVTALAWQGGGVSVALGFVLPFLIWNGMMGATTYLQHTNRRAPWYESVAAWRRQGSDEQVTVHLVVPRWYGLVSHHIMAHPAHHFQPRIPLYRLETAQARLNELLGARAVVERFSIGYLLRTVRACKLYDYAGHCWLDFAGNPTGATLPPPAVPFVASAMVA